ncbi:MAG: WD40 repeat domain-containing protein [Cyanobacteria bacterium P01_G01_bin.54]
MVKSQAGDLVLGGQAQTRLPAAQSLGRSPQGWVLGGIEGVKARLNHPNAEMRCQALAAAIHYGEEGLQLVLAALQHPQARVQWTAHQVLQQWAEQVKPFLEHDRRDLKALLTLRSHNPWPLLSCLHTLNAHSQAITSLALAPDAQRFLSGSHDKTLKLWSLPQGIERLTLQGHSDWISAIAFVPPSPRTVRQAVGSPRLISSSMDRTIMVWALPTGNLQRILTTPDHFVKSLAPTPDGQRLLSGGVDAALHVWDLATGQSVQCWRRHQSGIQAVAVSPDGQWAASGSADGVIHLWDLTTSQWLGNLQGHLQMVTQLVWGRDRRTLLSSSTDKTIVLWDLKQRSLMHRFLGHFGEVHCLGLSNDSRTLFSGGADRVIHIWDLRTRRLLHTLRGHQAPVNALIITPDSQRIISGSWDGRLKIWGVEGT